MPPSAETVNQGKPGTAAPSTNSGTNCDMSDPSMVREWLAKYHPKQLGLLDKFEMELRLGRLSTNASTGTSGSGGGGSSSKIAATAAATGSNSNTPSEEVWLQDRRVVLTVRTVELIKHMLGGTKWKTPAQLMALLKGLGRELHCAGGFREPAIGNVVRRVLAAVRDEVLTTTTPSATDDAERATSSSAGASGRRSLETILWALPQQHAKAHARRPSRGMSFDHREISGESSSGVLPSLAEVTGAATTTATTVVGGLDLPPAFYQPRTDLKQSLMEVIQEIMSDLEDLHNSISEQAKHHIHAGEIIFTYGRSQTVELFLKAAALKLKSSTSSNNSTSSGPLFTVIVAEGAPLYDGHEMAASLAGNGGGSNTSNNDEEKDVSGLIETIVISDAATVAIMARVHKVILPAHAVLANGGLIAPKSGSHMVALAARHHSVPVLCCTGMFKLTPLYPHEQQNTLNDYVGPSTHHPVVEYGSTAAASATGSSGSGVELIHPVHDYIRPELITLYVTNVGSFQPSYIYRLLAEYYHPDDWESFE